MFANANTVDPAIGSFTYTGNQRNIYIYKESTSTWSLIVQKSENYDTIHVNNVDTGHSYMDSKVTFTALNTHISTLPTTNLTQATFIGFTSAEKTKLSGIATGANKTTVDSALSSTSTNPVQNKIINNAITAINGSNIKLNASSNSSVEEAINGKASSSHTHNNVVTQNIPQNADLNSYTTVGVYRNGSNAQVQTMNNTPWGNKPSNGQAFVMVVLDHAGVTQILRP